MTEQEFPPLDIPARTQRLESVVYPMVGLGKLEAMGLTHAVIVFSRPPVNHLLHLFLSLVTCGFWLIVWMIIDIRHKQPVALRFTVDEWGRVWSDDGPEHQWVMRLGFPNQDQIV